MKSFRAHPDRMPFLNRDSLSEAQKDGNKSMLRNSNSNMINHDPKYHVEKRTETDKRTTLPSSNSSSNIQRMVGLSISGTGNLVRGPQPFDLKKNIEAKSNIMTNYTLENNSALPPV